VGKGVDGADATACIATFERPAELAQTIRTLLAGTAAPAVILVSEGSANPTARADVEHSVASESSPDVDVRLLPQPPNGTRNGNRNWLLHHVRTELALLLDDDIDVAPEFLADALERMKRDDALAVVTGTSRTHPDPVWLRHRGFFRPAHPGEPIAINTQVSLWRTDAYRSLWNDEAILYGFEEAELTLRLHSRGMKIVASTFPFVDRCAAQTVRYAPAERDELAERARCYVAAKRYGTRRALLGFLLHELALNVARRRRPLPRALVAGQWRDVSVYLAGGRRPAWADLRARPRVAHLDGEHPAASI
jgi:glycosyltransferase involved in cell wall biosynthesis